CNQEMSRSDNKSTVDTHELTTNTTTIVRLESSENSSNSTSYNKQYQPDTTHDYNISVNNSGTNTNANNSRRASNSEYLTTSGYAYNYASQVGTPSHKTNPTTITTARKD